MGQWDVVRRTKHSFKAQRVNDCLRQSCLSPIVLRTNNIQPVCQVDTRTKLPLVGIDGNKVISRCLMRTI
jgi:hypothetical protein